MTQPKTLKSKGELILEHPVGMIPKFYIPIKDFEKARVEVVNGVVKYYL